MIPRAKTCNLMPGNDCLLLTRPALTSARDVPVFLASDTHAKYICFQWFAEDECKNRSAAPRSGNAKRTHGVEILYGGAQSWGTRLSSGERFARGEIGRQAAYCFYVAHEPRFSAVGVSRFQMPPGEPR